MSIFGKWRGKNHNAGCTDPFCQGCHWKCRPNNSQCYTTNVEIIGVKPDHLDGRSFQGDVWIHRKYLSILKKIAPPGVNLISLKFKMVIMQNGKTLQTTPSQPLRCIWIEQTNPLEDGVVIHHPPASLPTMKGAYIFAPVSSKCIKQSMIEVESKDEGQQQLEELEKTKEELERVERELEFLRRPPEEYPGETPTERESDPWGEEYQRFCARMSSGGSRDLGTA